MHNGTVLLFVPVILWGNDQCMDQWQLQSYLVLSVLVLEGPVAGLVSGA